MTTAFTFVFYTVLCALVANAFSHLTHNTNLVTGNSPVPVVLYHGMGDTCCNPISMGYVKKFIQERIENVYVHSLMIGKNQEEDFLHGYFMDVNEQIEYACNTIKNDENLKNGFHAVGFSQGGQFLRAIAQRCTEAKILNLISIGGQHQGVYGFPKCPGDNSTICNLVRKMLNYGAYTDFVQKHLVQAQYWHDPLQDDEYKAKSLFLADINNEKEPRNKQYAQRLSNLTNFVLVEFADDTIVDPRESEVFGFYRIGQAKEIVPLRESPLYLEDWLGLKVLDQKERLHLLQVPGDHLQMNMGWFASEIIEKYLR